MMNNNNLKPINERADFIELSRKGGINSGISRNRRKRINEIANIYLTMVLFGTEDETRANCGKSKPERSTREAVRNKKIKATDKARKSGRGIHLDR